MFFLLSAKIAPKPHLVLGHTPSTTQAAPVASLGVFRKNRSCLVTMWSNKKEKKSEDFFSIW